MEARGGSPLPRRASAPCLRVALRRRWRGGLAVAKAAAEEVAAVVRREEDKATAGAQAARKEQRSLPPVAQLALVPNSVALFATRPRRPPLPRPSPRRSTASSSSCRLTACEWLVRVPRRGSDSSRLSQTLERRATFHRLFASFLTAPCNSSHTKFTRKFSGEKMES